MVYYVMRENGKVVARRNVSLLDPWDYDVKRQRLDSNNWIIQSRGALVIIEIPLVRATPKHPTWEKTIKFNNSHYHSTLKGTRLMILTKSFTWTARSLTGINHHIKI